MQISTFKLSDVELESGFFDAKYTPTYSFFNNYTQKTLNICNISCGLDFLFYTKNRKN